MSSDWFFLPDDQFNELLRLNRAYYREAKRCQKSKAYIAGCVMAGSALETSLVCMLHAYGDEVEQAGFVVKRKGKPKPLLQWTLSEMLSVAAKMGWLPRGIPDDDEWSDRRAKIGDYARALRQMRNLVHPARYLQDHSPKRVTKRYAVHYIEIFRYCSDWLVSKVHDSMRSKIQGGEL